MGRSTVHYADNTTNNILKKLHKLFRPAGTPVQRVEYIIELLLLRIFNVKLKHDDDFTELRKLFTGQNEDLLFSSLGQVANDLLLETINKRFFPFYASIMSQAKKVCTGNLGQKMLDQLVLIEEVFKNSNFTNNVKSGNIHEIIGLIGELDEDRLLKTDLLGDAIESALSESGGTKDIGLYRTPDHIRQFMVALTAPSYSDNIFDPACGTAGFLFDSFGYVLEGTSHNGNWPGEKAHPELHSYLTDYLHKNPVKMPSFDKSMEFYRSGLHGIEYLGMIRKMAAINFYIRGLNPANIEQGDSLAMFTHEYKDRFSVVLANPPFGAERDKDSYSNVWEEFPREAETTILFVKLMLDSLAPGGRCAVVVSEGFLSWDQTSARNLRKLLLEQTDLKAIISLPQGVFVSKGGVGPKTSILYFEKGSPTREVWYYRVSNDGYTMGTNRRTIEGCQLIEALKLFHTCIKKGETPPETKHSFSIPAEWILTLDPRIKERIVDDTTTEYSIKGESEKRTLRKKLDSQLKASTIDQTEHQERIHQYDEIVQSKLANEIARRIERAHTYSFNLPNYRSNLSSSQIDVWNEIFTGEQRAFEKSLDDRCAHLQNCSLEKAHTALAQLNVQNALEYDMARQYLMGFKEDELRPYDRLMELRRTLESGSTYPRVRLGDYLQLNTDRINPDKHPDTRFRVLGVSNTDGVFLNETKLGSEIKQAYYRVKRSEICYNPYRVNVGSIGICDHDYDNQIISGAYNVFGTVECELYPHYLMVLLKSPQFLIYVNEKASGGVRMNFKFEDLEEWEIPLPELSEQNKIIKETKRIETCIHALRILLENSRPDYTCFSIEPSKWVKYPGELITSGGTPSRERSDFFGGSISWLKSGELKNRIIYNSEEKITEDAVAHSNAKLFPQGTVLIALIGATLGEVGYLWHEACTNQNVGAFLPSANFNPKYIFHFLRSHASVIIAQRKQGAQQNLNLTDLRNLKFPWVPLEQQEAIVKKLDEFDNRADLYLDSLESLYKELEITIKKTLGEGL